VDHLRYRYSGPHWVLRLLLRIVPRQNQCFWSLNADAEIILQRKQEVAPAELRRQCAGYRKLAAELPNALLIQTDQDFESSRREACGHRGLFVAALRQTLWPTASQGAISAEIGLDSQISRSRDIPLTDMPASSLTRFLGAFRRKSMIGFAIAAALGVLLAAFPIAGLAGWRRF